MCFSNLLNILGKKGDNFDEVRVIKGSFQAWPKADRVSPNDHRDLVSRETIVLENTNVRIWLRGTSEIYTLGVAKAYSGESPHESTR